jgi:hypothetical protein
VFPHDSRRDRNGQSAIKKQRRKPAEKALATHQENVPEFQEKHINLETERLKLLRKRDTRKDEGYDIKEARLSKKDDLKEAHLLKKDAREEKKDAREEARLQNTARDLTTFNFQKWHITNASRNLNLDTGVSLTLPASKTDPFRTGVTIHMSTTNDEACPKAALLNLARLNQPGARASVPPVSENQWTAI